MEEIIIIDPVELMVGVRGDHVSISYSFPRNSIKELNNLSMEWSVEYYCLVDGFGKDWDMNESVNDIKTWEELNNMMKRADYITYRHAENFHDDEAKIKSRLYYNKCFSALLEIGLDLDSVVNTIEKDKFLFYEGTKENAWAKWNEIYYAHNIREEADTNIWNYLDWETIHRNADLNDNYHETEYGIVKLI